ncbi:Oidioi.mRNA.OKI2018_I69.XSR.g13488.t1.cds [Oikopleura dioica]|uniref:Oidioi.mRNA.OKI2018_I69.XSR.g13488.t1.cds n=1 Tax=Oikopleura dioica TaxID=34765 RepID=A0ABN7SC63_OIKDI|nr:Oidioi.mRNA.OKI2018_I69.XSR.g13488.t1.cds [Oikopleura dioica]
MKSKSEKISLLGKKKGAKRSKSASKGLKLAKRESAADARRRIAQSFAGNAVLTVLLITLVVLFVLVQQRNLDLEKLLPHLSTKPRPPIEGFESQLAEMLEKKDEVHLIQRDTPISLPELSQVDLDTLNAAPKSLVAPNPGFILHNKLPKCGSTTMHNILTMLSQWNNYEHIKIDSAMMKFDDEEGLAAYLKSILRPPMTVMKHHYFFNFTEYGMEAPTWINVMREPISWFESRYWFKQNVILDWGENEGKLPRLRGRAARHRHLHPSKDEGLHHRRLEIHPLFLRQLPNLQGESRGYEAKAAAAEIAKKRILRDYFIVGILEQFEDTLSLFQKLLPQYFKGAREAARSEFAKIAMNTTRTLDKKHMSTAAKEFLMKGPLSHEMDLYVFARALFNEKLRLAGLQAENPTLWDAQHPEQAKDKFSEETLQEKVNEESGTNSS